MEFDFDIAESSPATVFTLLRPEDRDYLWHNGGNILPNVLPPLSTEVKTHREAVCGSR